MCSMILIPLCVGNVVKILLIYSSTRVYVSHVYIISRCDVLLTNKKYYLSNYIMVILFHLPFKYTYIIL